MKSQNNPRTKPFQRWVCHEVLPSLRRGELFTRPCIQERELALREEESKREDLKLTLELCRGDDRAMQTLRDYRLNQLCITEKGEDIYLSIDLRLQESIRYELVKTIKKYSAHSEHLVAQNMIKLRDG